MVNLGDVSGMTGAEIDAASEAAGVTSFLRPEDGAWDTLNPNRFYFVTTGAFDQPSRLWAADFTDASNPAAGGTIKLLLNGTEGQQMLDNMTVDAHGKVILQEDVGNNAHLGKVWQYDPSTDSLTQLAQHDPDRFLSGGSKFLLRTKSCPVSLTFRTSSAMPARTCTSSIHRLITRSRANWSKAVSSS